MKVQIVIIDPMRYRLAIYCGELDVEIANKLKVLDNENLQKKDASTEFNEVCDLIPDMSHKFKKTLLGMPRVEEFQNAHRTIRFWYDY